MKAHAVLFSGVLCLMFFSHLFALPFETTDTLKVLALRVEFEPDNSSTTTGDGTFDLTTSSNPFQIDPPPHNRSYFQDHLTFLKNYFRKVSRGALIVEGDVFPAAEEAAYRLGHPMSFYNPNTTPDEINRGLAQLLRDALQRADEDPEIDFSRYDSYIVFHAGVGRDIDIGLDETPQDIPSLFITSNFLQQNLGQAGIPVDNGVAVIENGIILPETESQEGLQLGLNGMLVANFGSQLGWPDLFSPETRRSGVGRFGLMDAGLFNGDGLLPSLPTAWTRIDAGWENPITIYQAQDDEFEMHQTLSGDPRRVYKVPINNREYFLIENRYAGERSAEAVQAELSDQRGQFVSMREVLTNFFPNAATFSERGVLIDIDNPDRGLPSGFLVVQSDTTLPDGSTLAPGDTIVYGGGILIWHIDERIIEQNRAANRINADPAHRGIDLEEADGSQDIGEQIDVIVGILIGGSPEIGTALDPWYSENPAPLFISKPRNEFSLNSIPNTRSYYNRANSHIKIFDFSRRDSVMTFKVNLGFFQPNFPRNINLGTYGKISSLKAADLDDDGADELLLTTGQNKLLVMDKEGRSTWGNDSLEIFNLPAEAELVLPPAVFEAPDGDKAVVLLANQGQWGLAYGIRFNKASQSVDSLFLFQTPDSVTTFPMAEDAETNSANVRIFWGSAGGNIYQISFGQAGAELNAISSIPEAVQHLHFTGDSDEANTARVIVSRTGKVYLDEQLASELPPDVSQPVGAEAVSVGKDGLFYELMEARFTHPEDGIHQFDAPPIVVSAPDMLSGNPSESYVTAGQNQVHIFNYNLTLRENFPVNIYTPAQPAGLFLSPLAGNFPCSGEDAAGVVAVDPGGLITGYDLKGKLLPDFPLAIGDSINVMPALLDIDEDSDLELACVSAGGIVYVWDFSSSFDDNAGTLWSQQYGTPQNLNRLVSPPEGSSLQAQSLLPQDAVYNWPNPNLEDYTFIRYRLTARADVHIKIYDLAGDLVKEMGGPGNPMTDNEVRWDLSGVQSGVYVGRVEAVSSDKSEVRLIKIAVVK